MNELLASIALVLLTAAVVYLNVQVIKLRAHATVTGRIHLALLTGDESDLAEWRRAAQSAKEDCVTKGHNH